MASGKLFKTSKSQLVLRDITTHSYRTTNDVYLINIKETIPALLQIGFYIYNNTNQPITVTPIGNIFPDASTPDVILGTATTISISTAQFITVPSEYLIANYYSATIEAAIEPSSGYVQGFALINYNYTIS